MANFLNRFGNDIVGSDAKIFDYISVVTPSGDLRRIKNLDVIINSWNNILLTPKGSYIHDPEYGSNLHLILFEPLDDTTIERVRSEIKDCLLTYDDRAQISDINVRITPDGKGLEVDIDVIYKGERGKLSLTVNENNYLTRVR